MPEGDTLFNAALRLRPALVGATLTRFEAPRLRGGYRPRLGETIEAVEAKGKNLLIDFSGGVTLRTHLMMTGEWRLFRAGDRWRKPKHLARVIIAVEGWEAVCFQVPVIETFPTQAAPERMPQGLSHLGPDLCDAAPDIDLALQRMERIPAADASISDALLDQRVAAGIGNVYRNDVLFLRGIHPATPLPRVDDGERRALLDLAHELLRANLGTGHNRVTHPDGGLAVYGRNRRGCRVCAQRVHAAEMGNPPRLTYWCERCQPANGLTD